MSNKKSTVETVKTEERTEKAEKTVKAKKETLVYCGPSIPHICARYAMFSDVPKLLDEKAKEIPLIRNLIVPLSEFPKVRVQIDKGEGPSASIYREIQKLI